MAVEKAGSIDPAKVIAVLESTKFQFTKEQEWYRKEDHQGVNSCLVVEGIPESQRGAGGFGSPRCSKCTAARASSSRSPDLSCKMETA